MDEVNQVKDLFIHKLHNNGAYIVIITTKISPVHKTKI